MTNKPQTPKQDDAAPLRASLFAHLERSKLLRPLGGKDAVTPKIGEGWGSS